ncbi:MAG: hypothetical protein A2Y25_05485 [Candidatus Melainabacteria bacterium GWF2_37_15]|nr:MAG: hypothetical protein A2Y25_05485 [Candidatus Melainabacteria bacterium GWF2_37_15]
MIKKIFELIGNVLEYIYDFLFDWSDEPYEEQSFIESEKAKHSLVRAENKPSDSIRQEYDLIEGAFGEKAAHYLFTLKQEVDYLINKHSLVKENTVRVVIQPEKLEVGNINPRIIEETIEGVYSQYNKDVILKPGKINIMGTQSGKVMAELEIESYTVNDNLLNAV